MSIRALKKWALLLTFWVALQTKYLRATPITGDTVSGTFTATGNADIQGATLSLGTWSTNPGWVANYTDGSNAYVDFEMSRSSGTWRWYQNAASTAHLQLTLDSNNKLTLFDQSSTPVAKVVLDPLGTSTFANSVTLNGSDNEMPNQTLVNSHSVLTEGLADGRYLLVGSSSVALGYSPTATGSFATAMGYTAYASGDYSTAIGGDISLGSPAASGYASIAVGSSNATGYSSTAIGNANAANGAFSTALGRYSTASGYLSMSMGESSAIGNYSTAMGHLSSASGIYSTAMGYNTDAGGIGSTASGIYTSAHAFNSFAIGSCNVGGGDPNNWVATDPLFEIGNGTSAVMSPPAAGYWTWSPPQYPAWTSYSSDSGYYVPIPNYTPGTIIRSDAFVVYKNGNTSIQGAITTGSDANVGGNISAAGTVTAPAVIITAPTGDIPMFTGN